MDDFDFPESVFRYTNRHAVMGMMSSRDIPFEGWDGFYKNKDRTRATAFCADFDEGLKETGYSYMPRKGGKGTASGYALTMVVSRISSDFIVLSGKQYREIRETRNKWNRRIEIRSRPDSVDEVMDLIARWDKVSGTKYGWQLRSGHDRNFFSRYWEAEQGGLQSHFLYLEGALVGYSIISKDQDDNCFRYIIRKCDASVGRNIGLYADYRAFETIFANHGREFLVNWGASSGKLLAYKRKFPVFAERKVYFYKVKR